MVKNGNQDSVPMPAKQGVGGTPPEPNKIKASTTYDFEGRNLTAYGGLLPVATMLEKLGFLDLVAEVLKVKRQTKVMTMPRFVLAMVLASYVGFSRLYHVRFLQREPIVVRKNPVRACKSGPVTFRNVRSWAIHVEFLELPRCCALLADLVFGCR